MPKILTVLFVFLCNLTCLSAQTNLPKCFADFKIIQNVDSLEQYLYAHKDNSLAYMYGLISLERRRYIYKDKFGQDIPTIKAIAEAKQDELGKVMSEVFEVRELGGTKEKASALQKLYHADKYFTKNKDTIGVLSVCYSMLFMLGTGTVGYVVGTEKYYEYWLEKATIWGKETVQKEGKLLFYDIYFNYISVINREQKNFDEEYKMLRAAQLIIKELPNQEYYYYSLYTSFGFVVEAQKLKKNTLQYAILAFDAADNLGYIHNSTALYNLAYGYSINGQYDKAEKYYKAYYTLIKQYDNKNIDNEITTLNELSKVQYAQHKYKIAYENKLKSDSLNSIFQEKIKSDNIVELETQYEVEKKESQNLLLAQEKKNLEYQKLLFIISIVATSILLLVLGKIVNNLKRTNNTLNNANNEIEKQSRFRERLYAIIAHDLRSPLITYTGITEMITFLIKNKRLDEIQKMSFQLDTSSVSLINLIDNLLKWAGKQQQGIMNTPAPVPVKKTIENLLPIYWKMADAYHIDLELLLHDEAVIFVNEDSFSLIVRNLLDNAIKNTVSGQSIKVQTALTQEFVTICFINKSNAINPQIIQKIQDLFSDKTSDSEVENTSLGLGIVMVNEFVKNNNGTITLSQNADDYLEFKVEFGRYLAL